jgi:hypothetical protein
VGSSLVKSNQSSDSARHRSRDICPPISHIVLKNFIKISLTIKEYPEENFNKTGNCPEIQSLALKHFKDYKIGICFSTTRFIALRRKSKDWLARNRENTS